MGKSQPVQAVQPVDHSAPVPEPPYGLAVVAELVYSGICAVRAQPIIWLDAAHGAPLLFK
jgi:hypothetical protein